MSPVSFLPLTDKLEGGGVDNIAMVTQKKAFSCIKDQLELRQKKRGRRGKCVRCILEMSFSEFPMISIEENHIHIFSQW